MDEWIKKTHTHTNTHTHRLECHPAIKNEILVFGTTCMEPEGLILN